MEVQTHLTVMGSPVAEHGLWSKGSVVVVQGLRCPVACGLLVPQPEIQPSCLPGSAGISFSPALDWGLHC